MTNLIKTKQVGFWKGKHLSPETRLKMSLVRRGRPHTEAWKKNLSLSHKGRVFTQEHKLALSKAHKLRLQDPSERAKLSLYNLGRKHSPERRIKLSERLRGERGSNWQGGLTKLAGIIRASVQNKIWRSSVFTRDNFRCVRCGSNKSGSLNADHLISFSEILSVWQIDSIEKALACPDLWDTSNGQTLCVSCHKRTESYLNPYHFHKYMKPQGMPMQVPMQPQSNIPQVKNMVEGMTVA